MDHTVFTRKLHNACIYSAAAEHHRPLAGTHFTVPRRVEGSVDLRGWLHTEIKCRLREWNPDTVTHSSTNRARRRLTSLIETNALHTMPNRHQTITLMTLSKIQMEVFVQLCNVTIFQLTWRRVVFLH